MKSVIHASVALLSMAILLLAMPLASIGQVPTKDLVPPPTANPRALHVKSIAFSPDGRFIAAGIGEQAEAGEMAIWDAKTLQLRLLYKVDKGVPFVVFSPDSKTLAVGSFTEDFHLLDPETGKVRAKLSGHGEAARGLAFAPDGNTVATCSYDGSVRIWDHRDGKLLHTLKGHKDWVYSVAFSPDGKLLASSSKDLSIRLWEPSTGKLLQTWQGYGALLRVVAFDPTGRWLATPCQDGTLKIRDPGSTKILASYALRGNTDWVAIHPSGKTIAVGHLNNGPIDVFPANYREATADDEKRIQELIAQWDDDRMEVRDKASEEMKQIGQLAEPFLAKAAKESASAEVRMRARMTRTAIRSPKGLAELNGHGDQALSGAYSPDGQLLATGANDGWIFLWDTANYTIKSKLPWPEKGP